MATQELPEGTVTVLFTDVVGSTELANRLGDDAAREMLGACDELVRQQIVRHRGQEVKGTGDGLMVAFTSARRAIAAAVDIQRAVAAKCRREPERAVSVRIGLNTGEVIREEADLFGAMVTAADRIANHASPGEILLSDSVRGVLGTATTVQLEDRGEVQLRGFPGPWRLHAVRWEEPAAGPALAERTPFIGREEERAQLRRLLDQAARGEGALVMVGGEAGVGKTRLAQELVAQSREQGFLALTGHCYEMEGAPPYIPFVEILEAAGRVVPPQALRDTLGDDAPEVARLMPDLRRLFPDIGAPLELPPEQERHYLFNCVRNFIERAAREQPMFLVLEDLHWSDDSTLLLLQHIAQPLEQMPVLIIGTYRDVELEVARPLARALRELTRQRLAYDLVLRRLPRADVESMLRAISGQEPPPTFVRVIYGESEGNPFFVEEVFKHLAEEGRLFDTAGHWRPDLGGAELEVPRSVRLIIGQRLERVSEDCQRVLAAAAVVGRSFGFDLLEAVGETDVDALVDAIDEAERAHLVKSVGDGPEARFVFAHELIRQTLVSGLSLPRRQRMHLRVADAIERVYAEALETHVTDLAHHLHQAGSAAGPSRTTRYLLMAAEQALSKAAFEDALRYCEDAFHLLRPDDQRGQADLHYRRGMALRSLGRWEKALADWRQALTAYEEMGDADAVGRISWEICEHLGWGSRWVDALGTAQRGLDGLGKRVSKDRCRLLGLAGRLVSLAGDYSAGAPMIAEALGMAEQLSDQHVLGQTFLNKSGHHWANMQVPELLEASQRAVELIRSSGRQWEVADALWGAQLARLFLGRLDDVAEIAEELEPLAMRLGHLGALLIARRTRAQGELVLTGDIDRFEEFANGDLELSRSAAMPWISHSHSYIGLAHLWRGRWEEALASFREAARLEPPGLFAGGDWAFLFLSTAYAGDRDAALTILEQRRDNLPRPGVPNTMGAWMFLLTAVEGLAVVGDRREAGGLYTLVQQAIETGAVMSPWDVRLLQLVGGIAAACGEQVNEAERHYETALRQAHEIPHRIAQPDVRRWYARMLLDRDGPGDRDKARQLLTEAVTMYRAIGMPKHVEMAEQMLGEV